MLIYLKSGLLRPKNIHNRRRYTITGIQQIYREKKKPHCHHCCCRFWQWVGMLIVPSLFQTLSHMTLFISQRCWTFIPLSPYHHHVLKLSLFFLSFLFLFFTEYHCYRHTAATTTKAWNIPAVSLAFILISGWDCKLWYGIGFRQKWVYVSYNSEILLTKFVVIASSRIPARTSSVSLLRSVFWCR